MTQRKFIKLFKRELGAMAALCEAKNRDYSGDDDALCNLRLVETVTGGRLTAEDAMLVRICDKLKRVENLTRPGARRRVNDEPVTGTMRDAANYLVIWKIIREAKWIGARRRKSSRRSQPRSLAMPRKESRPSSSDGRRTRSRRLGSPGKRSRS